MIWTVFGLKFSFERMQGWEEKELINDRKLQKSKLAIPDQRAGPIKPSDRLVIRARWCSKESESTPDWILLLRPADLTISLDFLLTQPSNSPLALVWVLFSVPHGLHLHLKSTVWCSGPHKPYIFCKDMILAIRHHHLSTVFLLSEHSGAEVLYFFEVELNERWRILINLSWKCEMKKCILMMHCCGRRGVYKVYIAVTQLSSAGALTVWYTEAPTLGGGHHDQCVTRPKIWTIPIF